MVDSFAVSLIVQLPFGPFCILIANGFVQAYRRTANKTTFTQCNKIIATPPALPSRNVSEYVVEGIKPHQ